MDFLHRHIEALIFCAPEPLGVNEMVSCLTEMFGAVVPAKDVELALVDLCAKYMGNLSSPLPWRSWAEGINS